MNRPKEMYLRIVNPKLIYISSSAGRLVGARVNVYERGGVTALVNHELGTFHTNKKSNYCLGKNICSEDLVAFLVEKYDMEIGEKLAVWPSLEDDGVLFCARRLSYKAREYRFDDHFREIALSYRKRFGEWLYIEDNCISFTSGLREALPSRLSLYETQDTLALLGDPTGRFKLETRNRKGCAVYSAQLAAFCKRKFNSAGRGLRLHAVLMDNGVRFSDREDNLTNAVPSHMLQEVALAPATDYFIRVMTNGSIYVSAKAARRLGNHIDVYEASGTIALKSNPTGDLHIQRMGYQPLVYSVLLCDAIKRYYPGEKKVALSEQGDFMVLMGRESEPCRALSPRELRPLQCRSHLNDGGPILGGSKVRESCNLITGRNHHNMNGLIDGYYEVPRLWMRP